MLRARQSSHVENNDDVGHIQLENSVGYAECTDVEKDDYDQIPANRDTINHDYLVLNSIVKGELKQTNSVVHNQNIQPDSDIQQTKQSVLRQIFLIMLCIIITASVTAVATFFATKNVLSQNNKKCAFNREDASCPGSCSQEPCDNDGKCVDGLCSCNDGFAGSKCQIDVNQTCILDTNTLLPHPNICQLYYNCSQAVSPLPIHIDITLFPEIPEVLRPAYLHECPYPELFSTTTMSCQNYTDVKCGCRYETKNKCDYLEVGSYFPCEFCRYSIPDCVGFADGIHRNRNRSPPEEDYFECEDERNIYSGQNPCSINMAPYNGKCTDLFIIKPSKWQSGYAIDCSNRTNGNYKSEHVQKCDIYYTCVNGISTLTYCDSELVFDSKSSFCQKTTNACTPCGSVVSGC